MCDAPGYDALVIPSQSELPEADTVWGTGGWMHPEEREALDWLTMLRLLGWSARPERSPGLARAIPPECRCIVLACDPAERVEPLVDLLAGRSRSEHVLVVTRIEEPSRSTASAAGPERAVKEVNGRNLVWCGPGASRAWYSRHRVTSSSLALHQGAQPWVTLDGEPIVTARKLQGCTIVALGFHPSQARDADGAITSMLRHLLIWGSERPVAWLDLEGVLVLRMDDPGGSPNVHQTSWLHRKLDEVEWTDVGAALRRHDARLSIAYVTGWVDDADASRGRLWVNGRAARRIPGQIHPSPLVTYRAADGVPHRYRSEYRGIQALRAAGLAEVEVHGHTHIHPDAQQWAHAPNRHADEGWFRDLGRRPADYIHNLPADRHPLALALQAFRRYFGIHPTTLIPPGDQWTNEVLEEALRLEFQLVDSYYLAIRDGGRFWWSTHVCAPYLDVVDDEWFDAGLPVVGYFHDRDLAIHGVGWMADWLDHWRSAGARRLIDFRELAALLARRFTAHDHHGALSVRVSGGQDLPLARSVPVGIAASGTLPRQVSVTVGGREIALETQQLESGAVGVVIPPAQPSPIEFDSVPPHM